MTSRRKRCIAHSSVTLFFFFSQTRKPALSFFGLRVKFAVWAEGDEYNGEKRGGVGGGGGERVGERRTGDKGRVAG